MEALIQQAFLHVDVIGQHVAEGHYDLVGPNGDIIPPQLWDTVFEPDWTITMHMWPAPEKPKSPDPPIILDDNSDQFSKTVNVRQDENHNCFEGYTLYPVEPESLGGKLDWSLVNKARMVL